MIRASQRMVALVFALGALGAWIGAASEKTVIAHRGASAYAPEHTRAAYELAIAQKADYVEQDLAVTKDGALVCIHDDSLERTTNAEEVFPDRFTTDERGVKRWMVGDFTLDEIKRLDAGSWFAPKFAGERVLTWQEAVTVVAGRAGLYPELKSPLLYKTRRVDMVALFVAAVRAAGLDKPSSSSPVRRSPGEGGRPPLIVQSFDAGAIRALHAALPQVPRVLLLEPLAAAQWTTEQGLKELRTFATGVGPHKLILQARPEIVAAAHRAGLTVTPWTFRSRDTGRFPNVRVEMDYFLTTLGVDALFTDNPDQFPR